MKVGINMSAGMILFLTYIVAPVVVLVGLFGYLAHSEAKRYYAALEAQLISREAMNETERKLKKEVPPYRKANPLVNIFKVLGMLFIVMSFFGTLGYLGAIIAGVMFVFAYRYAKQSIAVEAEYFASHKEVLKVSKDIWTFRNNLEKYHWLIGMALAIATLLLTITVIK
jgi:hypothetical protein